LYIFIQLIVQSEYFVQLHNYLYNFSGIENTNTTFTSVSIEIDFVDLSRELQKVSEVEFSRAGCTCEHVQRTGDAFLSWRVRGSLHKRACERYDPCALDLCLMLQVAGCRYLAWVCSRFPVSEGVSSDRLLSGKCTRTRPFSGK